MSFKEGEREREREPTDGGRGGITGQRPSQDVEMICVRQSSETTDKEFQAIVLRLHIWSNRRRWHYNIGPNLLLNQELEIIIMIFAVRFIFIPTENALG
jgi:hypothetical protein